MAAILSNSVIQTMLDRAFCSTDTLGTYTSLYTVKLCKGVMPGLPTIETGVTYLSAGALVNNVFLYPSNGVTMLAGAIPVVANATGPVTFIRFFSANGYGVLDVSAATTPSDDGAVVNTLTCSSGTIVNITDLRIKINNLANFRLSNSISTHLLLQLTAINVSYIYNMERLAAASRYDEVAGDATKTVTMDIYSGAVPGTADEAATGTKLWTKASTNLNLFATASGGMSLNGVMTANAIATGTPTYFRITKPAYTGINAFSTGLAFSAPACIIQGAIGDSGGLLLSNYNFVSGSSYTAIGMAVTLQP